MSLQEFIFSNGWPHRSWRHFSFLSILGVAFFFQSIIPGTSVFQTAFFSLCCFFPTCIFSIYTVLTYLLPSFLEKKKHGKFLLGFLLLGISCYIINYQTAGLFLLLANDFGKPGISVSEQMNLSFINTSHALIIGGLALGIKFAKNLYLQRKENTLLARQKIITDLRLEKTRLYPRLLYQSLDNMRSEISSGAANASAQLLKVSELLSYILYDNNENWVSLEKELSMMQHLIDIELSGRMKYQDMQVHISGDPGNKYIVPMTLFPLLENCFKLLEDQRPEKPGVNLDIKIKTGELYLSLAINNASDNNTGVYNWQQAFSTTRQRLDALYPEGYSLEIKEENHNMVVLLNVIIEDNASSNIITNEKPGAYENA